MRTINLEGIETVTLRGGNQVIIRALRQDDAHRLQALFRHLSPESRFLRFLYQQSELTDKQARVLANIDGIHNMALVAVNSNCGDEEIIAVARYALLDPINKGVAEAAIVVEDQFQGQGLGSYLLKRLAQYASSHGIYTFTALVHSSNSRIMKMIKQTGLEFNQKIDYGGRELSVKLPRGAHWDRLGNNPRFNSSPIQAHR